METPNETGVNQDNNTDRDGAGRGNNEDSEMDSSLAERINQAVTAGIMSGVTAAQSEDNLDPIPYDDDSQEVQADPGSSDSQQPRSGERRSVRIASKQKEEKELPRLEEEQPRSQDMQQEQDQSQEAKPPNTEKTTEALDNTEQQDTSAETEGETKPADTKKEQAARTTNKQEEAKAAEEANPRREPEPKTPERRSLRIASLQRKQQEEEQRQKALETGEDEKASDHGDDWISCQDASRVTVTIQEAESGRGKYGLSVEEEPKQIQTFWLSHRYLQVSTCIAAGVVFGIAAEKSRVFEPSTIRHQMVFTQWIMLKFFFGAICASQLCFGMLSILPWTKFQYQEALGNYLQSLEGKGLLSIVIGAMVMGVGMTVSGACPGMVLIQIGSGTQNSGFTLLGVLLGTLIYGFVEPLVVRFLSPKVPLTIQPPLIYEKLKLPYAVLALPMSLGILVALALMEYFIPWAADIATQDVNAAGSTIATATSWPASVAGVLIGLLQLPLVLGVANTVGGSSGYVTIVSQWVVTEKLQQKFKYFSRARTGFLQNWWMVIYNIGIILGALFSSLTSASTGSTTGVSITEGIVGGFLLLFGARFASGCASGHGISGMSLLGWLSCFTVPCIFAGGLITAFIMQYCGVLEIH